MQRSVVLSLVGIVGALLQGCGGGSLLAREQRQAEFKQQISSQSEKAAFTRLRVNAAKVFPKKDVSMDDAESRTMVVQLNGVPCTAFPSAGSPWDLDGSAEIRIQGKQAVVKIDDLLVTHSAHRNASGVGAAILGDQRKPQNAEEVQKVKDTCLAPVITRLLEGV